MFITITGIKRHPDFSETHLTIPQARRPWTSIKTRTPSFKLVCKNATVVQVEHNFVRTEGPSSVPKSKSSNTKNFLNFCRIQMPTPGWQIKWINFNQMSFADAVKHHCWEDWPPQTGPEKAGQDTAHTQPTPRSCSNKNFKRLRAPTPQPDKQQIKYL